MTLTWLSGPGIIHRPINRNTPRLASVRRMNCHIAVSENSSIFSSFDEDDESLAHGYVRRGTAAQIADPNGLADMEQYLSLEFQGGADYDGNDATVSWETQGGIGDDAENGKWDPAQLRRLRWLWKLIREDNDLPNKLVTSSRLGSEDNRGLGWHRIGVDGNWPAGLLGGRLQRGATGTTDPNFMHWSRHWGKSCPGAKRIEQMASILEPLPEVIENVEDDDMAKYMVGDKAPSVYAFDTNTGLRRYVEPNEFAAVSALGIEVKTVPQATLDALPKSPGSK